MDAETRDLVRRMFASGLAMLEDATEYATAGQTAKATDKTYRRHAAALAAAAHRIASLAEGIEAVIEADLLAASARKKRL